MSSSFEKPCAAAAGAWLGATFVTGIGRPAFASASPSGAQIGAQLDGLVGSDADAGLEGAEAGLVDADRVVPDREAMGAAPRVAHVVVVDPQAIRLGIRAHDELPVALADRGGIALDAVGLEEDRAGPGLGTILPTDLERITTRLEVDLRPLGGLLREDLRAIGVEDLQGRARELAVDEDARP